MRPSESLIFLQLPEHQQSRWSNPPVPQSYRTIHQLERLCVFFGDEQLVSGPDSMRFFLSKYRFPRNLQQAICLYYDVEKNDKSLPQMSFVEDVTVGHGTTVPPKTRLVKTWKIRNQGRFGFLWGWKSAGGNDNIFRSRIQWGLLEIRISVWTRGHWCEGIFLYCSLSFGDSK